MVSITARKPGPVRWFTLRTRFLVGADQRHQNLPARLPRHIGTIHAARWVTIPGTRQLVFFSNYGGSWESYLEDFITDAHDGLTAVWSNSVGFPRAKNLFQQGATDGERFKRFARASMRPTRFWYSAYPDLTTDQIRRNAAHPARPRRRPHQRRGRRSGWPCSARRRRPAAKLETSQIQSLVFGGLGFMPHGTCLLYDLPDDEARARAFVAGLYPRTAFGDGRKLQARRGADRRPRRPARSSGSASRANASSGFPPAFLEGMGTDGARPDPRRHRRGCAREWQWGREASDVALLVYGVTRRRSPRLERRGRRRRRRERHGRALPNPAGRGQEAGDRAVRLRRRSVAAGDPGHLPGQPHERSRSTSSSRASSSSAIPTIAAISRPSPSCRRSPIPKNLLPIADGSRDFGNRHRRVAAGDRPQRHLPRHPPARAGRRRASDAYCEEQAAAARRAGCREPYEVDADYRRGQAGRPLEGRLLARAQPLLSLRHRAQPQGGARTSRDAKEAPLDPPQPQASGAAWRPPVRKAIPPKVRPSPPPTEPSSRRRQ